MITDNSFLKVNARTALVCGLLKRRSVQLTITQTCGLWCNHAAAALQSSRKLFASHCRSRSTHSLGDRYRWQQSRGHWVSHENFKGKTPTGNLQLPSVVMKLWSQYLITFLEFVFSAVDSNALTATKALSHADTAWDKRSVTWTLTATLYAHPSDTQKKILVVTASLVVISFKNKKYASLCK